MTYIVHINWIENKKNHAKEVGRFESNYHIQKGHFVSLKNQLYLVIDIVIKANDILLMTQEHTPVNGNVLPGSA